MSVLLVLSLFTTTTAEVALETSWTRVSSGYWSGREGLMGVSLGDYMYLSGGRAFFGVQFKNDVWRSKNGSEWELVTGAAPWEARAYHIMLESGSCMYVIGGQNFKKFFNDVWESCTNGTTWTQITASAPFAPRAGLAGSYFSGPGVSSTFASSKVLMIAGGSYSETPQSERLFYSDVWVSFDNARTWRMKAANGSASSFLPCSGARLVAATDGSLFLVGGERGFTTDAQLNHVYLSTNFGSNWTRLENPEWAPRSGHGALIKDGVIYVIAGWLTTEVLSHDMWAWKGSGNWTQVSDSVWNCQEESCSRFDFWSLVHQGLIYVFGGCNGITTFGKMFDETWVVHL